MDNYIFNLAVMYAQSKVEKRNLFCVVCQIEGHGLREVGQFSSEEDLNSFLFFNRGQYVLVTSERVSLVTSIAPFENGRCLN